MSQKQLALRGIETTVKEDAASRVGEEVFALILHASQSDPKFKLTKANLIEALRPALKKEFPNGKPSRLVHGRDLLFDAIAVACEYDPAGPMTRGQAKTTAVAKKDIMDAVPDVTPDEIARRAKLYVAKYRLPHCTPTGLAKHFCEFGPKAPEDAKPDIYTEPPDWKDRVREMDLNSQTIANLLSRPWAELPIQIRQQLTS